MPPIKTKQNLFLILIVMSSIMVCIWAVGVELRPRLLTWQHEKEMKLVIQHYYELLASVEGQSDPAVIATYAANGYLEYLLKVRCINCAGIQVAKKIAVTDLRVLDYSPTSAKVYARIEYGWNLVSPQTSATLGPCHAQAFSEIYLLVRQDNEWKIAGGEEVNPNRSDDTTELLNKYCESD
jgi:hypothetical protein